MFAITGSTNQDRIDQHRDQLAVRICDLYQFKSAFTHSFMLVSMRMKAGIGLEPREYNKLSD